MPSVAWLELPDDIDGWKSSLPYMTKIQPAVYDVTPASRVWRNSSQPCMTKMDEAYKQKLSAPIHSTLLDDFEQAQQLKQFLESLAFWRRQKTNLSI